MPRYNVSVRYSTVVEIDLDEDGADDEYAIMQDVLDEIDMNKELYVWDIEKVEEPAPSENGGSE